MIEKKYKKARGRKQLAHIAASKTKSVGQSQVEDSISNIAGNGYLVHPMSGGSTFCHFRSNSNQEDN